RRQGDRLPRLVLERLRRLHAVRLDHDDGLALVAGRRLDRRAQRRLLPGRSRSPHGALGSRRDREGGRRRPHPVWLRGMKGGVSRTVLGEEIFEAALALAGAAGRWLLIYVTDASNAACWVNEYVTWRDRDLMAWIQGCAVAVRFDARADAGAAR